ncbi:MAG: ribosome small subunit-dependent GTPase A [Lentimicrobium sp.]|nr:ribosome small subunit-dependent GTPase A [Lentimicrobium sp.]
MKGVVIRSTGSWASVMSDDGVISECRIKGNFRMKGIRSTNPVAVGDRVDFEIQPNEETGIIHSIADRHNFIVRKATRLSKQSHIIASNIDQAVVMATIASPRTSTGFIDRFLVTAEAYHIPASIIFNKCDLYSGGSLLMLNELMTLYTSVGYTCITTSVITGQGIESVKELLKDKVTLLSGHSGVGKSALINLLEPHLKQKVGAISDYHQKGKHTTTYAEMLPLAGGGFIIDTPGIKEFGLVHFNKQEVAERFPEMRELMHACQFNNCTHVHEPDCAVKNALKKGLISESRYKNYISILNDEYFDEKEWD